MAIDAFDPPEISTFTKLDEGCFHSCLAASSNVAVVLFSAPTCGACRAWKDALPRALRPLARHFFEVNASEATGIVRYFDIFHLPTIYLYRDGLFHADLKCPLNPDAILTATTQALALPAQDEP